MIRVQLRALMHQALLGSVLALSLGAAGCQPAGTTPTAPEAIDPSLAQYVLADVPTDVPNRCYLDFGGKVALVGYAIEPTGVAAPGSHVKLTLYWQSLSALGPGWGLFTHLLVPHQPHRLLDSSGPLRKLVSSPDGGQRQALGPSSWERGKIYVDPLEFDIPMNARAPELTVVAGVWRDALRVVKEGVPEDPKLAIPGLRLPVLSGPADDMQRGIVLHIETGLPWQMPALASPPLRPMGSPAPKARGQNEANGAH
jgi:hypothetical protein